MMEWSELLRYIGAPLGVAAVASIVAVWLILRHLEKWRGEVLRTIAREVRGELSESVVPVRPDDPPVPSSVCALLRGNQTVRMDAMEQRVASLETRHNEAVKRINERLDELPHRVVQLLREPKG